MTLATFMRDYYGWGAAITLVALAILTADRPARQARAVALLGALLWPATLFVLAYRIVRRSLE